MDYFKTFQAIVLIAILSHQSFTVAREPRTFSWIPFFGWGGGNTNAAAAQPVVETPVQDYQVSTQEVEAPFRQVTRAKRSFPWPSFLGGGGNTNVAEAHAPEGVAADQGLPVVPQEDIEIPIQHLSSGYHYPIWRVHKYNGIELKPMPISLVHKQHVKHLQQLYTQVPQNQVQHVQVQHTQVPQTQVQHTQVPQNQVQHTQVQHNQVPHTQVQHTQVPQTQLQHTQVQHTQVPHTQVSLAQLQQLHQLQQLQQRHQQQLQTQHFQSGAIHPSQNGKQNEQQITSSNCRPIVPFPPELQDLADQFGLKDASKLPSLDDAMSLLGTASRAETFEIIKELAATPDGMNLIRQFLATDAGAEASTDPNTNNQCNNNTPTQQFTPQQRNNVNIPHRQIQTPHHSNPHQQFRVPNLQLPTQHETYGLPNVQQADSFHGIESPSQNVYPPQTNIMSVVKDEAIPNTEYRVPSEIVSTAHSEHQSYNLPRLNIKEAQDSQHETYGLPNMKPAVSFQQNYYAPTINQVESVRSDELPHSEYNVPNEVTNNDQETQVPHQEYGVPIHDESNGGQQQEDFFLPKSGEMVNFLQQGNYPPQSDSAQTLHEEYGVPQLEQSHAFDHSVQQHENYGLPRDEEAAHFVSQGFYPSQSDNVENNNSDTIVPHNEYTVPNEVTLSDHQTQVPHEVYGVPNEDQALSNDDSDVKFGHPPQIYAVPEQTHVEENVNVQHDEQTVSAPHHQYAVPVTEDTQTSAHHESYGLPHQRFFDQTNTFRQQQITQYGAPTQYKSNNVLTHVPILREIDSALDRAHTNLQLGQLLTTTVRPEAGLIERVTSWTKYFAPPAPSIPIDPPKVTEDVNESAPPPNAYAIPIPKIPELNEPQTPPTGPQLPNVYIPRKFITPSTLNQGPFFRAQNPKPADVNEYGVPHMQPQPFDGQTMDQFVPDISHLPLDDRNLSHDLRTSYGVPAHPDSYAADSSPAASETHVQTVSVALPNQSGRLLNQIEIDEFDRNEVVDGKPQKKHGPQRISSYDSYATGKLNRANDDAINRLIPTQRAYYGRRLGQVEDSSIIDAIATMTSGFRPIT